MLSHGALDAVSLLQLFQRTTGDPYRQPSAGEFIASTASFEGRDDNRLH